MTNLALHIVYATDLRYLLPTQVAVSSAIYHATHPKKLYIDILDCGIPDKEWDSLEKNLRQTCGYEFSLFRYKVDMTAYNEYKTWHNSRGIYARLSITDILPLDIHWCIYADSDTLFTADPFELVDLFDNEVALLGHLDESNSHLLGNWYVAHGFKWEASTYICAGFICINLDWFRKNDIAHKSFEMIQRYPDIPLNDQDVLNILCQRHKRQLPGGWGVFSSQAIWHEKPKCIHYVGERPWEYSLLFPIFMPETTRIWFKAAKNISKLQIEDINNGSKYRYFLLLCGSKISKVVLSILVFCGMKRYQRAINRFVKFGIDI